MSSCLRTLGAFCLCLPTVSVAALDVNPAMPIRFNLTVQPIVVSNTDGSDTAEYFGTASQQSSITGFIDEIWAQAGVDVNWLPKSMWNNTNANQGTIGLSAVVSGGDAANVDSDDPYVVNMYFVEGIQVFGGPFSSENKAAGFASVGGNGITQYVGSGLLDWSGGRELIAEVVAHEIGHNLGLSHTSTALFQNLMNGAGTVQPNPPVDDDGGRLTQTQIDRALGSQFLVAVNPATPGDFNGDGFINAADYTVWRDNLGASSETALNGNGSNSGGVDIADFTLWKTNFGMTAGSASLASSPVPEPTSLLLLLTGVTVVAASGRRRATRGVLSPNPDF